MTKGTMKIFQTHEKSGMLPIKQVFLGSSYRSLYTPMRALRQERGQQGAAREDPVDHHCGDGSVISLENLYRLQPLWKRFVFSASARPTLPVVFPSVAQANLIEFLTFISLNILQSFSVSFRIKSNFQCSRKVPCYWPLPHHSHSGWLLIPSPGIGHPQTSYSSLPLGSRYTCSSLSARKPFFPSSFPGRFFLFIQTLVSWGNFLDHLVFPSLPPLVQVSLVLPQKFLCVTQPLIPICLLSFYLLFSLTIW